MQNIITLKFFFTYSLLRKKLLILLECKAYFVFVTNSIYIFLIHNRLPQIQINLEKNLTFFRHVFGKNFHILMSFG
jgi:hypothetical protein